VASSVTTVSAALGGEVTSIGASNVTSRGICYSTTASPTVANNTVASGSGIGSFNLSIPGLNPATTYYVRAYATNATGTSYGNQVTFTTLGAAGQACAQGSTLTVTHTAGDVAPVTKTVTYKLVQTDLSGASKCWIAQNLGAERQGQLSTDFSEESAGWYWQFNRKQGYKHDGMDRFPLATWIVTISENSHWTAANDPCALLLGSGWRIPTQIEWETSIANLNRSNVTPFNGVLRLHHSGYLDGGNGQIISRGLMSLYQLKNQASNSENYKGNDAGIINWNFTNKNIAAPIRCIKD
jgi:predicted lipoprotein with Yx(FWY)xxD motif